jgi:thioredoxin-like negative regulator of GroEL
MAVDVSEATFDCDVIELSRQAPVVVLSELEPGDPKAIRYRRRLATALY